MAQGFRADFSCDGQSFGLSMPVTEAAAAINSVEAASGIEKTFRRHRSDERSAGAENYFLPAAA